MLKCLRITNLVLVESVDALFDNGFNVITGETGAGKSALLHALNLLRGEKADPTLIRSGETKGIVEAAFDIDTSLNLLEILRTSGIDHEEGEELLIKREVSGGGKGRLFINNQLAPLSLLRQVGFHLFNLVGQQANRQLADTEQHREMLDLFGNLNGEVEQFGKQHKSELALKQQLKELLNSEGERLRTIEICKIELEELHEADLKLGEEEELFQEYSLLSHAEERSQKSGTLYRMLSDGKNSALDQLEKHKLIFEQLTAIDPSLEESFNSYRGAILELEEIAYMLRGYKNRVELSPDRIAYLNERLSLLNKLKKKYGGSIEAAIQYQATCLARLDSLESCDIQIEELKAQIEQATLTTEKMAQALTTKRLAVAKHLQEAVTQELRSLNMPQAIFEIAITKCTRHACGDDAIEFFLSPNVGERAIPVKNCASGGEIARIMLALQTLLVGKRNKQTLLLDEIDANIGGETASEVGKKLRQIGQEQQLICITHFPQVANQAHHHLKIAKRQENGRTFTEVFLLKKKAEREEELQRMRGGEKQ